MHLRYQRADRLSCEVIGAAIEVHRHKGPGLIESIYERCLLRELELRSIPAITQKIVRVQYKGLIFDEPLRFDLRSLLECPAMPRCFRFFVFPRREECAYPQRSVIDEQRRKGGKAAQPGGLERLGLSGYVAHSSQVTADMLVARALPSTPNRYRAARLGILTGS